MSQSLISVIVPVYNVKEYLNTCVESILNQTHENLEVILVDDEKLVAEAIRRQVDWEYCGAVLCRVCLNAFEALKAVEEVRPDIIITDIKMPVSYTHLTLPTIA